MSGDPTYSKLNMSLLRQAVPERSAELDRIIEEARVQIEAASDQSGFRLDTGFGAVLVGHRTPAACWIMSDAAWRCIAAFAPAVILGAANSISTAQMHEQREHVAEVARRLEAARALLGMEHTGDFQWPAGVPQPQVDATDVQDQAVRDIAQLAWAFMLLHEIRHAHLAASNQRPDQAIDEERDCDQFSITFMLDGIKDFATANGKDEGRARGLRAMGVMTGLFAVAVLGRDDDGIHPPARERLVKLFDAVGHQDAGAFWFYAVTVLMGAIQARGGSFDLRNLMLDRSGAALLANQL